MAGPRGADSAAGSLRGVPHRPGAAAAQPAGPEAPGGQERQAPITRSAVLTFQVTGFSELRNYPTGTGVFVPRSSIGALLTAHRMPDYVE